MKTVLASVGVCCLVTACITINDRAGETRAAPADETHQDRGALSGQKQLIASFYATAPDCASLGYPTLKVATPPQHGQVSVEQGTTYAAFGNGDVRSHCSGEKVAATLLYYTSEAGFLGTDSTALERIGVAGAYGYHAYTIHVR